MSTPVLSARGLRRSFGPIVAADHMDCDVHAGKVTALVGPNGAGKTTLLLMLAGLLEPDEGTIMLEGVDATNRRGVLHPNVGWMPDNLGTYESLTTTEILTTFAAAHFLDRSEATDRVEDLLRSLDLVDIADTPARVLSRGQRQRVGLGRALIHDPPVLLLDEPASGLDPSSRVKLWATLDALTDQGKAVMVSSHMLEELAEFTDEALFVVEGRTIADERVEAELSSDQFWRFRSLDPRQLFDYLTEASVSHSRDHDDALIRVVDEHHASALLRDFVHADIDITLARAHVPNLQRVYTGLTKEHR